MENLIPNRYYHLVNREKHKKLIQLTGETFAYTLLSNFFHLVMKIDVYVELNQSLTGFKTLSELITDNQLFQSIKTLEKLKADSEMTENPLPNSLTAHGWKIKNDCVDLCAVKIYDRFLTGLRYYDFFACRKELILGDELILKREPENKHDAYAISAFYKNYKLGYITSNENITLVLLLDGDIDLKAEISELNENNWHLQAVAIAIFAQKASPKV